MDYASEHLSLQSLERLVARAGSALDTRYVHFSVGLRGLRHPRHAKLVEGVIARQPGVYHASVSYGSKRLYVEYGPRTTESGWILNALTEAGVSVADERAAQPAVHETAEAPPEHAGLFGQRSELVFALVCGLFTALSWGATKVEGASSVALVFALTAYAFGSWFTLQELVVALRARRFEIDFLMLLAAAGAAALDEWVEGALLLFLFSLGHVLEGFAMRRARNAVSSFARIVPETALRVEPSGAQREVPLSELQVGDWLIVQPNTRIPADGFVADGTSRVNQAPITGESAPFDKRPVPEIEPASCEPQKLADEHKVFAGSINGPGALLIVTTKTASDSTVARMLRMVADAETQKSPTQKLTERFERVYVPVVMSLVLALLFAWAVVDEPFAISFYRAMAVMVAASPCALAIATPSAVLAGVARAARSGVLFKGGEPLETLGMVQTIAFDKTSTLTEGRPKLTDVRPLDGVSEAELLGAAVALEKRSDHPVAAAIVAEATCRFSELADVAACTRVEAIAGYGVAGFRDATRIAIGRPALFAKTGALPMALRSVIDALQTQGRTVMVVRAGEHFLGVLGMMDLPRSNARFVVERLHAMCVERIVMLTGDHQQAANSVAKSVGIHDARNSLLPEQKVAAIEELSHATSPVAMIGDCVNDAPAMARATVGIAMGAGSSEVALEAADVAIVANDLSVVPFAVGLSRAALRIIRQNLWGSLGMVTFLVPATLFGFTRMGVAALLHQGSTLLVVANALRLLAYDDTYDLLNPARR